MSALIVRVPEAEGLVAGLRQLHDPSAREGVPAHITVLVPFKDPGTLSPEDLSTLRRIFRAQPPFTFVLDAVGRWPETAFLVPHPAHPFVALTTEVARAFPDYPPYEGRHREVLPHLTVADGSAPRADEVESELRERLHAHGPVQARCGEIELLGNSAGRWTRLHVFRLGDGGC